MKIFLQVMGWILRHCINLCSQSAGAEADSVCLARLHAWGAGALPVTVSCQLPTSQPAAAGGLAQHRNSYTNARISTFQLPSWGIEKFSSQDTSGSFLNWGLREPFQIQGKHFKCSRLKWLASRMTSDFQEVKEDVSLLCTHICYQFFSDFSFLLMSS